VYLVDTEPRDREEGDPLATAARSIPTPKALGPSVTSARIAVPQPVRYGWPQSISPEEPRGQPSTKRTTTVWLTPGSQRPWQRRLNPEQHRHNFSTRRPLHPVDGKRRSSRSAGSATEPRTLYPRPWTLGNEQQLIAPLEQGPRIGSQVLSPVAVSTLSNDGDWRPAGRMALFKENGMPRWFERSYALSS